MRLSWGLPTSFNFIRLALFTGHPTILWSLGTTQILVSPLEVLVLTQPSNVPKAEPHLDSKLCI